MVQTVLLLGLEGVLLSGDYAEALEGRLAALSRVDRLFSSRGPGKVGLSRLLEDVLLPTAGDRSTYTLDGPDLALSPDWAFALSLLFHELATNAKRHGSLSAEGGRVEVRWHLKEGDLVVSWSESGGPPVRRPSSPGFGNLLVNYAAVKLKGSATVLYLPTGLRCDVRVSLLACWPQRRGAMRLGSRDSRAPLRAM